MNLRGCSNNFVDLAALTGKFSAVGLSKRTDQFVHAALPWAGPTEFGQIPEFVAANSRPGVALDGAERKLWVG